MAAAPSPGPAWSRAAAGDRGALRSRQTQRPASEPAGPTVAADDAPTSCLGDNGTASLPWALSTATCSAQVRRPASRPSCPLFPASSQPQRPTPRCRQICAGTTSSCSNFPDGSVHFRPFPLEKISPAPGNRIQLTFFNGHYDSWCYLPLLGFLTFDDEVEQYLCAAVLRPGNAVAADGTLGLLCRLLPMLRAAFPRARFLVRLDGGFATPEIFDFLDAEPGLDYVVAMAKNAVLQRHAEPAMAVARAQSEASGRTEHVYTDTRYAARTWSRERRVVIKAEVVRLRGREPRDNPRFVVTNLRQTPRFVYEKVYCARGDIENRIKELLDGLQIDRTSCCKFWANQLRVLLTAAAYVLMQELRLRAARTGCARTQVTWLRDRLLKLGVHVVGSARRIVLHLPRATPHLRAWRRIALALGACAG